MTHRSIQQFVPHKVEQQMSEAESIANARAALHAEAQADGERLDADPRRTDAAPREVRLVRDDEGEPTGVEDAPEGYEGDGVMVTWAATSSPIPEPTEFPTVTGRRVFEGVVPEAQRTEGGTVAIKHGLGAPVTVTAYDDAGQPIGYVAAFAVSANEEQVELVPGAATVRVIRDEDA